MTAVFLDCCRCLRMSRGRSVGCAGRSSRLLALRQRRRCFRVGDLEVAGSSARRESRAVTHWGRARRDGRRHWVVPAAACGIGRIPRQRQGDGQRPAVPSPLHLEDGSSTRLFQGPRGCCRGAGAALPLRCRLRRASASHRGLTARGWGTHIFAFRAFSSGQIERVFLPLSRGLRWHLRGGVRGRRLGNASIPGHGHACC